MRSVRFQGERPALRAIFPFQPALLSYIWQILLLNMKLLAYIWHSACENSHFESTFLELSTRATAIYKRDASSQTLKSAIYSRDTRESALFSTQSSNREVVHPATPFTRIRLWSSLRLRTVFPSAHPTATPLFRTCADREQTLCRHKTAPPITEPESCSPAIRA